MIEKPIADLLDAMGAQALPCIYNEPLDRHTTFKIGGPAAVFCKPRTVVELTKTLELCRRNGVRTYLLGNGSNTLFADEGFSGAVICLTDMKTQATAQTLPDGRTRLTASAGTLLVSVCNRALELDLTGLEFAFGIPGTVGGAVYMNAGAYGGEMKDVLDRVTFLDEDLKLRTLPAAELALGYRTSIFEKQPWCILEAELVLQPGNHEEIQAQMQDYMSRRREKQPLDMPSAGSTFKRPAGCFAGQLIEQCGLRGFSVGGATVSQKHCGFVVNTGGATCADVVELTDKVRDIVKEKTGHVLEREIRVVR